MVTEEEAAQSGAVYRPAEMVPTMEFPPTIPFTYQFTAVLLVPVTVAVNCLLWPVSRLALVGETETPIAPGEEEIVTLAVAEVAPIWVLCAEMVITGLEGTELGARYIPLAEIVPREVLPPGTPLTDQCTAESVLEPRVALNCRAYPA